MRVIQHPVFTPRETEEVTFTFAGRQYTGLKGESIAAALLANGVRTLRHSEKKGEPRGLYCGIGHCYECRSHLDGAGEIRACITPVEAGMCLTPKKGGAGSEG
ncbi:UNVERIFIED_CONTAM: sarcosine oxidase subunit alpha [Brevibacillus sp. OAP136]